MMPSCRAVPRSPCSWLVVLSFAFFSWTSGLADVLHAQQGNEIVPGVHRIDRLLGSRPFGDLRPLDAIVGNAEVVALGESIHTSGGFYRMKLRLIQYLVEERGFRAFGIESPWIKAESAVRFVRTCQGNARSASQGLFGVWQSDSMTDLLDWMCRYNQQHPNDPLVFFGFDGQQPDDDFNRLRPFLEAIGLGNDAHARALETCHGIGGDLRAPPSTEANNQACLDGIAGLENLFARDEASIVALTSVHRLGVARLNLVGLRAWQGQSFWSQSDQRASTESRDAGMALAVNIQRGLRAPGAKTILWAHNAHIAKSRYSGATRWMGSHLDASLGNRYVTVGLVAYRHHIDWPSIGCGDWSTATPNSIEGRLQTLNTPLLLVDLDFPGAGASPFFDPTRGLGMDHGTVLIPRANFDAIAYLESSRAMRPTAWAPCGAAQVGTSTDPVLGCNRPNGHGNFCGACGPCLLGEGDCDANADCAPGLACAQGAGPTFGLGANVDVCVASTGNPPPPPPPGGCDEVLGNGRYCTSCGPCGSGQGDCDRDSECQAGLTCVDNIGADFGFAPGIDVCVATGDTPPSPPPAPPGGCNEPLGTGRYCTTCGPCESGQGDCDNDAECQPGLSCVDNIGADFGFAPGVDVCVAVDSVPPGTCPEALGSGRYCSTCGPCAAGQGDCDSDAECQAGLSCIDNIGAQFGFAPGVDVCG